MGNMCLDLCKDITANDKKARLTKEIKDIHPIDDGSLLKISYTNGSVFYSKLTNGSLLRETSRLNGEVRYTRCGDYDNSVRNDSSIDDNTISELNDLIREVSGGEDTHNSIADDTIMTRSSTSLEISNLLANLENNKILHLERTWSGVDEEETLLCVQDQRCSTPKQSWQLHPKHRQSSSRLGYQRLSDCNNNIEPEEEITYLLNRLSIETHASASCSQENLFSVWGKNGDDTFDSDGPLTTTDTTTTTTTTTTQDETSYSDSSKLLNTTCETSFSEELVVTKITTPEPLSVMNKLPERKPPDRDPTVTVIDAYLENIDENFSKEDEINYLLSLLKGEDEAFNKEYDDSDDKVENNTVIENNSSKQDKDSNLTNILLEDLPPTVEPKNNTPKKKQIVRKISPAFSKQNDLIIPARKGCNTYEETNNDSNKENMDAINAMDFLCQLICSAKAPPLLSKPTRPCPTLPKKVEILNLLTELEKDHRPQNSEKITNSIPKCCNITSIITREEKYEKSNVNSTIKEKTNDSESSNYVNSSSITSLKPIEPKEVRKISTTDEDDYLSEEAELSSMMSTITETSDDMDDLESLQDLSTEVEIESLLSKLSSVQLVPKNDSLNGETHNQHNDLNSLMNDFVDSTCEPVLNENHGLTSYTNTNASEKSDISDLFSFLDNAKKAYAAADKCDVTTINSKTTCNGHTDSNKENTSPKYKPKNGLVTQEVDLSEISVTYRHIKKSILLNEDEFSEETKSIKKQLHFYTRGLRCRSLSPCYERDEANEFNISNSLSLEQLIEQLASFQGCVTR